MNGDQDREGPILVNLERYRFRYRPEPVPIVQTPYWGSTDAYVLFPEVTAHGPITLGLCRFCGLEMSIWSRVYFYLHSPPL